MKKKSFYHKRTIGKAALHPETLMINYGYSPTLSEGAVKPPVYLTSTFAFESAQHGKDFFDIVSGRKKAEEGHKGGLVYSRFNHPNSEIVEDRLAVYEDADTAALFSSGMAAITTAILAHANPNDVIVHNLPLYGGTDVLFVKTLSRFGIRSVGFTDGVSEKSISEAIKKAEKLGRIAIFYLETPSNPLNSIVDISLVKRLRDTWAKKHATKPVIMVDNTLLGPVYQKPLKLGADLSIYSLTKYVGGHSDLVAGAVVGSEEMVRAVKLLRSSIGTQLDPHSSWMIGRSLETLTLRMRAANEGALTVAKFLKSHPKVTKVFYPEFLSKTETEYKVYKRQCEAAGSTFSFNIKGGRKEAFAFLDALQIFKLAVSLGGTESLVCHPATTVHSGVPEVERLRIGITEQTIRLSVGIEHPADLVADLTQALKAVKIK